MTTRPLLRGTEHVRWWWHRPTRGWSTRAGWSGISALVGLLLLLAAWLYRVEAQQRAAAPLRLSQEVKVATRTSSEEATSALAELHRFVRSLPSHEDIPDILRDLMEQADEQTLTLRHGSYRPSVDAAGQFFAYRINWPIQGEGSAVTHFVAACLDAYPSLLLERLQISRKDGASTQVDAIVQWVLLTQLPEGRTSSGAPARHLP